MRIMSSTGLTERYQIGSDRLQCQRSPLQSFSRPSPASIRWWVKREPALGTGRRTGSARCPCSRRGRCWVLKGKQRERPRWVLLGGKPRPLARAVRTQVYLAWKRWLTRWTHWTRRPTRTDFAAEKSQQISVPKGFRAINRHSAIFKKLLLLCSLTDSTQICGLQKAQC